MIFLTDVVEEVQAKVPTYDYSAAFLKMIILLSLTIGFLILTYFILKKIMRSRFDSANKNLAIKILEKRVLSPKTTLYMIEVNKEKVLIAESQMEVRKLINLEKDSQ